MIIIKILYKKDGKVYNIKLKYWKNKMENWEVNLDIDGWFLWLESWFVIHLFSYSLKFAIHIEIYKIFKELSYVYNIRFY